MKNFSFGQYADAPYDVISREFSGNAAFQKQNKNILITIGVVGFLFFTIFFIFFAIIAFGIISIASKNKKFSTIRSIACYGIDYSIAKGLEKKGKLKFSDDLNSRLPSKQEIQEALGNINGDFSKTYSSQNKIPQQVLTNKVEEKTPELNFDFGEKYNNKTQAIKVDSKIEKQTTGKRKSVFDDYVSVKDIFKDIKKR